MFPFLDSVRDITDAHPLIYTGLIGGGLAYIALTYWYQKEVLPLWGWGSATVAFEIGMTFAVWHNNHHFVPSGVWILFWASPLVFFIGIALLFLLYDWIRFAWRYRCLW